ncbi:putative VRG4-golgi GDP-mannose transporter [Acaromyces ingoldii]|uniref:GDP-mannose transporter n=1 Tax=Acaromyces ingoldii TaxID=215250 RepID=A0A316YQ06_9BASI|nr:putative VRG4-golgi GDP-mannose transporter [Acaromyces ingoldii]PWN90123.1 putative VRG4-golgi GDP-mannose transporter [Acaromyces ingoldii]
MSNNASRPEAASRPAATTAVSGLQALAPILSYCIASITMTVFNKYVLNTKFSLNLVVLLIQSIVGVLLVIGARSFNWIEIRPLNMKDVKLWLPVSTLLVLVIWTGSKALQFLTMAVYTIFKNLTIILIAYGEVLWFGGKVTRLTLFSFILMVFSSLIAAYNDIAGFLLINSISMPHTPDSLAGSTIDPKTGALTAPFDALGEQKAEIAALESQQGLNDEVLEGLGGWGILNSGYLWMGLNCACSAAYVLYMRKRIKVTGFKDWDTMFYNNLLTIPVLLGMSLVVEDWSSANFERNFPKETRHTLITAIIFSGACAVFISYTTAWCVRVTSSTTYSMVGALNKLPLALSGMVFFGEIATFGRISAIGVGFIAGLVYAYAKNLQAKQGKASTSTPATGVESSRGGSAHGRSDGVIPMHNMNGTQQKGDRED